MRKRRFRPSPARSAIWAAAELALPGAAEDGFGGVAVVEAVADLFGAGAAETEALDLVLVAVFSWDFGVETVSTWGAGRDLDFSSLGLREGMSVDAARAARKESISAELGGTEIGHGVGAWEIVAS